MELNHIMRMAANPAAEGGANGAPTVGLEDRVQKEVKRFFPDYREKTLALPPHIDAFYDGLKKLPLRRSKPGDSEQAIKQVTIENRKIVSAYMKTFSAGGDKPAYPKMIDRGMALVKSRQLLEGDIGYGQQEKITLDNALKSTFASVSGLNSMTRNAFLQDMILDPEDKFKTEEEW